MTSDKPKNGLALMASFEVPEVETEQINEYTNEIQNLISSMLLKGADALLLAHALMKVFEQTMEAHETQYM